VLPFLSPSSCRVLPLENPMRAIGSIFFFPSISRPRHVLKRLVMNQSWTTNLTLSLTECALETSSPTTESAIETLLRTEN